MMSGTQWFILGLLAWGSATFLGLAYVALKYGNRR